MEERCRSGLTKLPAVFIEEGKWQNGRRTTVAPSLFLTLFCFENIFTFFCSFDRKSSDV
jgi:hypothetical protein